MADLKFSIYMTAHAARDFLNNDELFKRFINVAKSLGVSKVYVENYRDGQLLSDDEVDAMVKRLSGDFELAGGTAIGTWGSGWFSYEDYGFKVACISDDNNKRLIADAMRHLAGHFNEVLIDDFWAQWCHGEHDVELFNRMHGLALSRGELMRGIRNNDRRILDLWTNYSASVLLDVSENFVVKPAREVNKGIRVNLKVAEWREDFPHRGLILSKLAQLFDSIYVGTESREGTEQYGSFLITEYVRAIVGDKLGGVWFDTFNGLYSGSLISLSIYLKQLWFSALTSVNEVVFFDAYSLTLGNRAKYIDAVKAEEPMLKSMHSNQTVDKLGVLMPGIQVNGAVIDRYVHDYLGMIGVPLRPINVNSIKRGDYVLITEHAVGSIDIIELARRGVNLIVTSGAAELIAEGALGYEGFELLGLVRDNPLMSPVIDALYLISGNHTASYTHRRPGAFPIGPILNTTDVKVLLEASDGVGKYPVVYVNEFNGAKVYVVNLTKYPPYLKDYYPELARRIIRDIAFEYVGVRVDPEASMASNFSLIPYANKHLVIYNMNEHPINALVTVDAARFNASSVRVIEGRGNVKDFELANGNLRVRVGIEGESPLMIKLT
ncbi:hypothetical protein [Caldivirga maquilingensis]|uniref:Permease n=1 Tax=Caldivirga maquilingensis (strain ATCC 700844 / DSM 13496 / JCM 10307 / IC-167) TaxID=397948 RepID=A8MBJ2_CALMQ|nr:hypothetical protein [Caldivirga maquilingensis]ABW02725.1 Permease [Caldivirga maquilingensis IC-167]